MNWAACDRCRLVAERNRVVYGDGSVPSPLLIIGEGPGRNEDQQGKPFVGAAGVRLRELASRAGLPLSRCYITNVIACRPPDNRIPMPDEAEACRPRLAEIAKAVKPHVILLLGGVALVAITGEVGVKRWRGRWLEAHVDGLRDIPAIATFHPASLLRSRLKSSADVDEFVADVGMAWMAATGKVTI